MTKSKMGTVASYPEHLLPAFIVQRVIEGAVIVVVTAALFVLLSLVSYHVSDPGYLHPLSAGASVSNAGGRIGAYLADMSYFLFGYFALLFPLCLLYIAWMLWKEHRALLCISQSMLLFRTIGLVLLFVGGCGLCSLLVALQPLFIVRGPGGLVGHAVAWTLAHAFNVQGASLLLFSMFLIGITWLTGLSWIQATEWVGRYTLLACRYVSLSIRTVGAYGRKTQVFIRQRIEAFKAVKPTKATQIPREKPALTLGVSQEKPLMTTMPIVSMVNTVKESPKPAKKYEEIAPSLTVIKTERVEGLPALTLLEKGKPGQPMGGFSHQELETLSRNVEQHLLDFGIQADVVAVHPGPVITRFELQLAAGVKASKLTALSKDLARSLSVTSVRVVEIIPGKTVVGIELPNQNRAMVYLSDILSSDVYQNTHSPLTLALGVDIAGHPMVVDLAKMPHLLVAGTTGSGKSVGINAMILSLLFKLTPEQVRLIMIDPKMLELSVYDGIPHLLTPVVTDMKEAASALRWCVAEMERRYRLMAALGVRNIIGYNTKITDAHASGSPISDPLWSANDGMSDAPPVLEALPYVVVIIDELADMMMVVGKKVEQLIARIAQKARAAGIHLILATQRPSVDVLTGLIKSNIPTRISFQVSSKIDSRTILDQQGAEQLLGQGDMLFLAPGSGAPFRVHAAFVDDQEVHRIADDWRARGTPTYIDDITQMTQEPGEAGFSEDGQAVEEADPLYDQAVEFVMQSRKASISAVQRRFKVGYNRAARLIEEMERTGLVGPLEGGFRDVLVSHNQE